MKLLFRLFGRWTLFTVELVSSTPSAPVPEKKITVFVADNELNRTSEHWKLLIGKEAVWLGYDGVDAGEHYCRILLSGEMLPREGVNIARLVGVPE